MGRGQPQAARLKGRKGGSIGVARQGEQLLPPQRTGGAYAPYCAVLGKFRVAHSVKNDLAWRGMGAGCAGHVGRGRCVCFGLLAERGGGVRRRCLLRCVACRVFAARKRVAAGRGDCGQAQQQGLAMQPVVLISREVQQKDGRHATCLGP